MLDSGSEGSEAGEAVEGTAKKKGVPHLIGRFGMNDYVARVVEREGDTSQSEVAKALALAARTYVVQHGNHDSCCLRIDDSSSTQRVMPLAPAAAR